MNTAVKMPRVKSIQASVQKLVSSSKFEWAIVAVIIVNAVLLGLETSSSFMQHYGDTLPLLYDVILWIFVAEIILKWIALAPNFHRFFKSGWNCFDFAIVACSFLPSTGSWVAVVRMARLLRVLRLITAVPRLRFIVQTLLSSLPSIANVILLMLVIFYVYAILGFHLFSQHDPTHWETLPISFLTLFRIVTLEDWTDVMYTAMEISPYMSLYFVSFVVVGTFVFINLFVAVMLKNADSMDAEAGDSAVASHAQIDELMAEVKSLKKMIQQHSGKG